MRCSPAENGASDGEDELVELDLNGEQRRLLRCVGVACAMDTGSPTACAMVQPAPAAKPERTLSKHRPELHMCILGSVAWRQQ